MVIKIYKIFGSYICLALYGITFYGCSDKESGFWGEDPKGAEIIYECGITPDTEGFEIIEDKDKDGSRCVIIKHQSFPESDHCRLYSPNGNLRIIASGPVLQCGFNGYRIDYDKKGRVCNVVDIGERNGVEPSVSDMKEWLQETLREKPEGQDTTFICRDEEGKIFSIGNVMVPSNYTARYYIKEWGPFWGSEVDGGCMGFFISIEKIKDVDGSYVNYLYCDGKLIAELAYWKGVFIKARTYNKMGVMVDIYTDRSIDVAEQAYEDHWETPMWYID